MMVQTMDASTPASLEQTPDHILPYFDRNYATPFNKKTKLFSFHFYDRDQTLRISEALCTRYRDRLCNIFDLQQTALDRIARECNSTPIKTDMSRFCCICLNLGVIPDTHYYGINAIGRPICDECFDGCLGIVRAKRINGILYHTYPDPTTRDFVMSTYLFHVTNQQCNLVRCATDKLKHKIKKGLAFHRKQNKDPMRSMIEKYDLDQSAEDLVYNDSNYILACSCCKTVGCCQYMFLLPPSTRYGYNWGNQHRAYCRLCLEGLTFFATQLGMATDFLYGCKPQYATHAKEAAKELHREVCKLQMLDYRFTRGSDRLYQKALYGPSPADADFALGE